ncbi:Pvc16 family protein [Candidatus Cardinium hertigii]|uniref:Pvc16 family protein n=1 Tax=Candidatus Cardinium hertigii TaxID=247481 RepID=UPI003D7CD28F
MLHHCTRIILSEANQYIQSKMNVKGPAISLAILANSQVESKSGIMMRLVDITSVELCSNPTQYVPQGDGFIVRKAPEAFNLYFLFSIDYKASDLLKNLELLAYIATFFQNKSHFDTANTPILQEIGVESFSVELVKMTASEKTMLWESLHAPYSPSLLYKVGLIFIGDTTMGLKVVSTFSSHER